MLLSGVAGLSGILKHRRPYVKQCLPHCEAYILKAVYFLVAQHGYSIFVGLVSWDHAFECTLEALTSSWRC